MARDGLGGRRGSGGGRAGGREAGDLAADRGETRRAGHHQALPHPGSAFCTLEFEASVPVFCLIASGFSSAARGNIVAIRVMIHPVVRVIFS